MPHRRAGRGWVGAVVSEPEYQRLPDDFEGDYTALLSARSWTHEMMRLRRLGIERSGRIGSVCPDCMTETTHAGADGGASCDCGATYTTVEEIIAAHGIPNGPVSVDMGYPPV